jgi:hypothetical protein
MSAPQFLLPLPTDQQSYRTWLYKHMLHYGWNTALFQDKLFDQYEALTGKSMFDGSLSELLELLRKGKLVCPEDMAR